MIDEKRLESRIDALERAVVDLRSWQRERQTAERRAHDEQRHEFERTLDGAKAVLERIVQGAMSELTALNKEQLELLKEARDERIRRRLREEDAEQVERQRKAQREADAFAAKQRRERWKIVIAIVGPVLGVVGALIAATVASHYGANAPTMPPAAVPHH